MRGRFLYGTRMDESSSCGYGHHGHDPPPVHAADTIKIGVPGAHSGDLVSYGMPSLNAARIVADEYNAKGGILGKQIEIVAEDDQCKPELGTNAATKVLSEGAVAVMGSICSGATKAALPIYNDAKIVSISPSATTPELTQKGDHPYFFRTIASDDVSGHLAGSFAKDKLGLKKVALLHDKGDYGRGFVNYAREMLEKGGVQIVLEEGITPGAVDYGAVIQKIRKAALTASSSAATIPKLPSSSSSLPKRRSTFPSSAPTA